MARMAGARTPLRPLQHTGGLLETWVGWGDGSEGEGEWEGNEGEGAWKTC